MSTPLQFFKHKNGRLHCENVPLEKLAKKYGTPLYVYSTAAFLKPLQELRYELKNLSHLICFATKSNSNLSILSLINKNKMGADVVSGGELVRARKAGIHAKNIVFSGVGKTQDEISLGIKEQIHSFNVESIAELIEINRLAKQFRTLAPIALRFNPNINAKTHPYISTGLRENKFGLDRDEIHEILKLVPNLKNICIEGLSIHIGSQITELSPLDSAFSAIKAQAKQIEVVLKRKLDFLDLGGGLGVTYKDETPPTISNYGKLIRKHFENTSYRIILEPGRLISANSGVLLTQVIYRKSRKTGDFLILDSGMNDLMRPALYNSHHEIVCLKKSLSMGKKIPTHFVGPVCESSDFFAKSRPFSNAVESGDFLAILSAGAYGMSMSSNYNSRPRAAEILVDGSKARLTRRREKLSDLLSFDTLS